MLSSAASVDSAFEKLLVLKDTVRNVQVWKLQ